MSIIDHVNWSRLDRLVKRQQSNREAHAPVVSLFRWWARRPHAVAGALLDAAKIQFESDSFLVADPFSGGGTVAFEAVRRGLSTYAQDLYRWPSFGLAVCLRPTHREEFTRGAERLLEALAPLRKEYWHSADGHELELTHIIRVRAITCSECSTPSFLFREPFVSLASRSATEKNGFFGCKWCGQVSLRRMTAKSFACDGCGVRASTEEKTDLFLKERSQCVNCGTEFALDDVFKRELCWHPVLVQERERSADRPWLVLRPVRPKDPIGEDDEKKMGSVLSLDIAEGLETRHLLRSGFQTWGDLFSERQLRIISDAVSTIATLDVSPPVRDRLTLAVLGATEMPAYLSRWERFHPKAIEAIANHRFARATVVVETNLLSPVGRGTIPRRLAAVKKALNWLSSDSPLTVTHKTSRTRTKQTPEGVLVVTGSSERQLLPNKVASLILTDPPYHDDLQYGELSRLFHAWMKETLGGGLPNETAEAVPNCTRGAGDAHYASQVAACLRESRRTLKADGRLVLTFHNRNLAAWKSLAAALRKARFLIVGLATVSAENAADHSKRDKDTFLCDLVIECIRAPKQRTGRQTVTIRGASKNGERKDLIAIGRAIAAHVNGREGKDVATLYKKYRTELGTESALIS